MRSSITTAWSNHPSYPPPAPPEREGSYIKHQPSYISHPTSAINPLKITGVVVQNLFPEG